jgi:hypothetical protein
VVDCGQRAWAAFRGDGLRGVRFAVDSRQHGALARSKSMTSDRDDIVIFHRYDTVIDANIAKTKLDAHGIPCFLSGENMSSLYPSQPLLGLKVALHLFRNDTEKAETILGTDDALVENDQATRCPACQSTRIERDFPKEESESLTVLFFGVLFPGKKVNHCLDCDTEF